MIQLFAPEWSCSHIAQQLQDWEGFSLQSEHCAAPATAELHFYNYFHNQSNKKNLGKHFFWGWCLHTGGARDWSSTLFHIPTLGGICQAEIGLDDSIYVCITQTRPMALMARDVGSYGIMISSPFVMWFEFFFVLFQSHLSIDSQRITFEFVGLFCEPVPWKFPADNNETSQRPKEGLTLLKVGP